MAVAIISVVVALAFAGLLALLLIKRLKAQAWQGVVAGKNTGEMQNSTEGGGMTTYYYLQVNLDDGKKKRANVSRKVWDGFEVGDRIVKEAGKYNPTKG